VKLPVTYQFEPAIELPVRLGPPRKLAALRRLFAKFARSEPPLKRDQFARLVPKLEVT
jgi:hypothetical protein